MYVLVQWNKQSVILGSFVSFIDKAANFHLCPSFACGSNLIKMISYYGNMEGEREPTGIYILQLQLELTIRHQTSRLRPGTILAVYDQAPY